MSTVTISPKFQVVIPKVVRGHLKLKAGQKVEILEYDNRIELIPIGPMKSLRGLLPGINPVIDRDPERFPDERG